MELVKTAWRLSAVAYKTNLHLVRNCSKSSTSSTAEKVDFSPSGDSSSSVTDSGSSKLNDDKVLGALGATDELSSYLGLAREFACEAKVVHPYTDKLRRVQTILFDLSRVISKSAHGKNNSFENKHTKDLEEWIIEYTNQLPPAEDYIIPGGGKACASLHIARAICNRAERSVTTLVREGTLDSEAETYLKRLSDFLLTVSRIAAKCDKRAENIYIPRAEVAEQK